MQRHLIIPVALGSMALAGAGWFVGIATGSPPATTGTSVTTLTITEKGTVVSVHGAPEVSIIKKKIPARTITRNGKVITLPASTLDVVRTQTRTISHTTPGRTVTSIAAEDGHDHHNHHADSDSDRADDHRHQHGHHLRSSATGSRGYPVERELAD